MKLTELQDQAKTAKTGKWADNTKGVREIKTVTKDLREFVDKHTQKPIDAIVEMVLFSELLVFNTNSGPRRKHSPDSTPSQFRIHYAPAVRSPGSKYQP